MSLPSRMNHNSHYSSEIMYYVYKNIYLDDTKYAEYFFKECIKRIKRPYENEGFVINLFRDVARKNKFSMHLTFCFDNGLISDADLITLDRFLIESELQNDEELLEETLIKERYSLPSIFLKNKYIIDLIEELSNHPRYKDFYKNPYKAPF
jgi:hypothetical protein